MSKTHGVIILLLLGCTMVFPQAAASPTRFVLCRSQPRLVGKCFAVRGRLSVYNGSPSVRLWKVGTHRMLGVSDSYTKEGMHHLPPNVAKALGEWQREVWGDYVVCPFTGEKPQEMQMVCIASGKNLFSRARQ